MNVPAWVTGAEWTITLLGVTSGWLIGQRNRVGFVASLAAQSLWLAVAADTAQWAFVPTSIIYGALAVRGWWRWRPRTTP